MATRTSVNINVDHTLRLVAADLPAIREVLDEWETLPDIEHMVWTREWEQLVMYIHLLEREREAGHMDGDSETLFASIIADIGCIAPALRARGFVVPQVVASAIELESHR